MRDLKIGQPLFVIFIGLPTNYLNEFVIKNPPHNSEEVDYS